jgi:hypothetical protein
MRARDPNWKDNRDAHQIQQYHTARQKQYNAQRRGAEAGPAAKQQPRRDPLEGPSPDEDYALQYHDMQQRQAMADDNDGAGPSWGEVQGPPPKVRRAAPARDATPTKQTTLDAYIQDQGEIGTGPDTFDDFEDQGLNTLGVGGIAATGGQDITGIGFNKVDKERGLLNFENGGVKTMTFSRDVEHRLLTYNNSSDIDGQRTAMLDPAANLDTYTDSQREAYIVPYGLMRAAMTPGDLLHLFKHAFVARVKRCGFAIKSAKETEIVIEGSNYNPRLRDKNPLGLQIQSRWANGNAVSKLARSRADIFPSENPAGIDLTGANNDYFKRSKYVSKQELVTTKTLPKTSMVATSGQDNGTISALYNEGIPGVTPENATDWQGRGRDFIELDDEWNRHTIDEFVGQTYSVDWGNDQHWYRVHDCLAPAPSNYFTATATTNDAKSGMSYHDKMMLQYWYSPSNPQEPAYPYSERLQDAMSFPDTMAFNTAWPEYGVKTYNEPQGKLAGLLKGFPEFSMRVVDEDDMQGPITRSVDMVFTYFVELEFLQVKIPRQHFFAPVAVPLLAQEDYTNTDQYQRERQYNFRVTRLMTMNDPVPLMIKNRSIQGYSREDDMADTTLLNWFQASRYTAEAIDYYPLRNRIVGSYPDGEGRITGAFENCNYLDPVQFLVPGGDNSPSAKKNDTATNE